MDKSNLSERFVVSTDVNSEILSWTVPGVSYACVVGAEVHPGPTPVRRTQPVSDEFDDLPELEEIPEEELYPNGISIPDLPKEIQFGFPFDPLPPLFEGEENEIDQLFGLYAELAMINDLIAMSERLPMEARSDLSEFYLNRLRLSDKIDHLTPSPPPRTSDAGVSKSTTTPLPDMDAWDMYYIKKESLSLIAPRSLKSRRKRTNRSLRRASQKRKRASEAQLIEAGIRERFAYEQGGFVKSHPDSITARNICLLSERGIEHDEITVFMRGRSFARNVFSLKTIRRMVREVLQMRSAYRKLCEAAKSLNHKNQKAKIQKKRKRERDEKYAETQGLGEFVSIALKVASHAGAACAAVSLIKGGKSVARSTRGFLEDITFRIKEFADKLGELGDAVRNCILAALLMFLYCKFEHKLIRAAILASIPLIFSGTIRKSIFEFFQTENVASLPATQSGIPDQTDLLPGLISVSLLTTCGMKSKHGMLPGLVDNVGKLPRTINGVEALVDWAVKATQVGLNVILRWLGRPEVSFRKQLDKKVDEAIKTAHAIDQAMNDPNYKNKDSPQMYHTCMESYAELTTLMAMHHENIKVKQALSPYRAMMGSHCGTLRNTLGRGAGFRQEPLSVVIESRPGVGKTMNMPALIGTVLFGAGLMTEVTPEKLHQAYFTRPANSDFFDGYHGQECYFIDDIFSRKPNLNGITQFDEVMAFYGTTTTMLNMAALEQKGMYPFTSSLLLMTTNLTSLSQIGADAFLLEPKAFERRVDIHVHIEVRSEYSLRGAKEGQLDYSKYSEEVKKLNAAGKVGREAHPWYMWECWDTYFGEGQTYEKGSGRCFSEVVDEIIDGLKMKTTNHVDNMAHLANIFKKVETPDEVFQSANEIVFNQSGGSDVSSLSTSSENLVSDEENMPVSKLVPLFDKKFPRYSEFKKMIGTETSSTDGLGSIPELIECDSPRRVGKFRTDKNYIERKIKPSKSSGTPWFVNEPQWLAQMREEDIITDIINGFLTGIGIYIIWQSILRPFLSALCGFVTGAHCTLTGENQSNGPRDKKIIRIPEAVAVQAQAPDFGLWERVYKQTFKMVINRDDGKALSPFGQVLFLEKNLCVMPHHFLDQLRGFLSRGEADNNTLITFYSCGDAGFVQMSVASFNSYPCISFPDRDLHFIHFKKNFRMYKSIIPMVIPEARLQEVAGRPVRLDTATISCPDGYLLKNAVRVTFNSDRVDYNRTKLRTDTGRCYNRYLSYSAATAAGDCGAPLSLVDYRHFNNQLVCGLHVAGMPEHGIGYATVLTQEICLEAKEKFKHLDLNYNELTPAESFWPAKVQTQSIGAVPFTEDGYLGNAMPVCTISEKVSIPVRSSKRKTFMGNRKVFSEIIEEMNEGREPPELVPMKLGKYIDKDTGEVIYPMEEAVRPYVDRVFVPVDGSFKVGLSCGLKAFADATISYSSPILTAEEAILGVPGLGLKSITRSTSVGFPLGIIAKNKKHFFGSDEELDITRPEAIELIDNVNALVELLKQENRPFFVCKDFLKDEVRKVGKKARLIAGTDLTYYILCRMYFGAYVGAMCRSHAKSGICLGMNPYAEWGGLRTMLERPDPTGINVWDGDFAGFDSSQMPQLLWDCLEYINNWYFLKAQTVDERKKVVEDNTVRTMLFLDLVYSKHITGFAGPYDTVVEWCKSLPSGHFLTAPINSMLSIGSIGSGYVALTGETNFWETSAAIVMGDDNVVSTSVEYVERFNQVTLADYLLKAFGMKYTPGRKGEDLKPVIGIDDVVFLQRRFAIKNGLDVCPIRPESFLHSLYYVDTNDATLAKQTLLAGIELAFEELSMHDESYWPHVSSLLAEQKKILGETPEANIMTSEAYFWRVRNRVPSYV